MVPLAVANRILRSRILDVMTTGTYELLEGPEGATVCKCLFCGVESNAAASFEGCIALIVIGSTNRSILIRPTSPITYMPLFRKSGVPSIWLKQRVTTPRGLGG